MQKFDLPSFDACRMENAYGAADPELGPVPVPGSEVAGNKLNEDGMRGPLLPIKKKPGNFRILFLGDSTCWGIGVKLEDSFAALATRLIAENNSDREVEYLLGAFPGYSSYQSGVMLKRLINREPDLVVFYVGANNDHTRARYFKDSDIPERSARLHATWHKIHLLRLLEVFKDKMYRKFLRKLKTKDARARVPIKEFH
jgi:lysophospholipase L1-like esterase